MDLFLMTSVLGPDIPRLFVSLQEARTIMNASRKSTPGGWLLSPPVHLDLVRASHRWAMPMEEFKEGPPEELLGLPYRVVDTWAYGWQLMDRRWWDRHVK